MSEKLLNDVVNELSDINSKIPSETSLFDVENKLDRLIEIMENQSEISERLNDKLDRIYQDMPEGTSVNLSYMESLLDKICDKLDTANSNLGYIESNTGNLG